MIRVGIGGWTYEPWRGSFYPPDLPKARELDHASRHVTLIEINSTFYSRQKPETWANWARRTPDDFVFSVKASRFCTNRRNLADASDSIAAFLGQGLVELGAKLGPILWQLPDTKVFDPIELRDFLSRLPPSIGDLRLRHVIEPRHESFGSDRFVALMREARVAIALADAADHPQFADLTADFVYARLQQAREAETEGYSPDTLDLWSERAIAWQTGQVPDGLRYVDRSTSAALPRDVFLLVINGAKVRAPAAAQALIARLSPRR